ncbi:hypothetical protein [Microbacterium deminutum]|uniref:Uncharacterized protein n=1 Tax=Microbacterium deminutum TaxID=344164 RepID=A0ABN2QPY3_9MICO
MTMPLVERRRAARHRRALGYWGVMLSLYLSLWLGTMLVPPRWLHMSMLFAHLASIIVGLGAAVFLEFNGLLWMIGRRTLADLRHTERSVSALAWIGILGLFASGAFLQPNLQAPLTEIKMLAVLVVAMNGVAMTRLTADLARLPSQMPFRSVPPRVRLWCVWSALVSQAGWWTAVVIGMLNTASH